MEKILNCFRIKNPSHVSKIDLNVVLFFLKKSGFEVTTKTLYFFYPYKIKWIFGTLLFRILNMISLFFLKFWIRRFALTKDHIVVGYLKSHC